MICTKCGADAGDFSYCPNCGEEIVAQQLCVNCGTNVYGRNFCPHCGEKVPKAHLCAHCGTDTKGSNYCPNCGEEVLSEVVCLNCGADVKDSNFCPNCGTNVKKWNEVLPVVPVTPARKKTRKPKTPKPEVEQAEVQLQADLADDKEKTSYNGNTRQFTLIAGAINMATCLAYAVFVFLTHADQHVPVYSALGVFVLSFFLLFLTRVRRKSPVPIYAMLTAIMFISMGFKIAFMISYFL